MRWISAVFALVLTASVAVAAEPEGSEPPAETPSPDRPWAEGVSEEQQAKALELFKDATALLKDAFFTKSVEVYRQALEHWDHPAIHFNLAKALMNLDQPVEAYTHLDACLRYDGRPLDEDQIDQARRYKKLLYEAELASLAISCDLEGAKVSLNGVELFTAPGKWEGLVKADKHTILATKEGFQPAQEQRKLPNGELTELKMELIAIEKMTKYTRAMAVWKPWVVVGSGAAALIAGGVFSWQSSQNFSDYDKAVEVCNAESAISIVDDTGTDTGGTILGCQPSSSINDKKSSGELFQTLSIVSYVAGGVTLATGLVLLYVNREKPVEVEVPVDEPVGEPVTIVPHIGPDGAGVSATVRF